MVGWGAMALFQCAAKNFAGILVIRLLLGAFEGKLGSASAQVIAVVLIDVQLASLLEWCST
jgi:hypothetical protein